MQPASELVLPMHRIECPNCGQKLKYGGEHAGRKARCKTCGISFRLPVRAREVADPRPAPIRVGIPTESEPQDCLPRERAEAIVRATAQKHKAKGVLKRLGTFDPKLLANAKGAFARDMGADEVPLVLIDRSFLQNGKAGVLLTNRRLYSSTFAESIPLGEILAATVEEMTPLQQWLFVGLLGPLGYWLWLLCGGQSFWPRLLVNGEVVYEGKIHAAFWNDLLPRLALACREGTGGVGVRKNVRKQMRNEEELAWLVAAAVCSGKSGFAIIADFTRDGADQAQVRAMADAMTRLRTAPRAGTALGLLATGAAMILAGLAVTITSNGDVIWYGPVLIGIPLAGIGFFRLCNGSPPLRTEDVKAQWDSENDPDT